MIKKKKKKKKKKLYNKILTAVVPALIDSNFVTAVVLLLVAEGLNFGAEPLFLPVCGPCTGGFSATPKSQNLLEDQAIVI